MNEYRFHLQKTANRAARPSVRDAGRKSCFTRYIDEAAEMSFPGYVGKCDHINSCGYHYSRKNTSGTIRQQGKYLLTTK